ncbi:hypothetical protein GGR52DRAFT_258713 [Hypoxylon sp. FL1284]|nr:hypothetical protein GGR52DRAFT_258713 [Hypoxylon sp. FL1284]
MSSSRSYSGLGAGSDSYGQSSQHSPVTNDTYRSHIGGDYKVETCNRKDVSVHNYKSSGYDRGAPHPTYGHSVDKKDRPHEKPASR